jgi:hypothetical protein
MESHCFSRRNTMNARRFVTFMAAILITAGQTLLVAAATAATAQAAEPSVASVLHASAGSGIA